MYIDHSILKETIPSLILVLYIFNEKTKTVFNLIYLSLIAFTIYFTATHLLGIEVLGFITSNWRTWATPALYLAFILATYHISYSKTRDLPYSITLSTHMALATGYLYEAPRYLILQGPLGLIRYSKYSLFTIQYALVSIPIIYLLLRKKGLKHDKWLLFGALNYLIYFTLFILKYEWLQNIRFIKTFDGYFVPWIYLYRLPTMIMFLIATSRIKGINFYTGLNNYTIKDE